jgi:hypothetical protein
MKGIEMRKLSELFKRAVAFRRVATAPTCAVDRALAARQLDTIAAAGGKSTTSSNPVED